MENKISIIGGDLRIVKLAKLLQDDGITISTFGLDTAQEIQAYKKCTSIEQCLENSKTVISSIPFSKDGVFINAPFASTKIEILDIFSKMQNVKFIAGAIKKQIVENIEKDRNIQVIDILESEALTIMNAIPTAEGAIQLAMENSYKTIHNSNALIMGFGRIGKVLSKMIKGIGANVYCEARQDKDIAWIQAYGYIPIKLSDLEKYLSKFDFIFNTIPTIILDRKKLEKVKKDCLIIDLASQPGGIDFEAAKQLELNVNWALGLPR